MKVGKIIKAATFKSFSLLKLLKCTITFFVTALFNVFMKRTLTDDYWGLHKNMICAFPLKHVIVIEN